MALSTFCGGRIFGVRVGTDARVLALHGWARDHGDWSAVLDGLGAGTGADTGAVAVDLPGFGASPPPAEAWGSREYARELMPLIEELVCPAVVAGHSFGGRVALHLADLAGPEVVGGMMLSGVPLGPRRGGKPKLQFRVRRALNRVGMVSDDRMEAARQRFGSDDYRRAEGIMRAVLVRTVAEDYSDVLARMKCPVEMVWGIDDTAAPVEGARRVESELAAARLTEIEGGHFACFAEPEVTRDAITRLVAGLDG